ncbi:MAG: hypothetical protein KC731_23055 [Myxococcales bacterium]|nr:hypothetical protein [Myxococcales bacterium]
MTLTTICDAREWLGGDPQLSDVGGDTVTIKDESSASFSAGALEYLEAEGNLSRELTIDAPQLFVISAAAARQDAHPTDACWNEIEDRRAQGLVVSVVLRTYLADIKAKTNASGSATGGTKGFSAEATGKRLLSEVGRGLVWGLEISEIAAERPPPLPAPPPKPVPPERQTCFLPFRAIPTQTTVDPDLRLKTEAVTERCRGLGVGPAHAEVLLAAHEPTADPGWSPSEARAEGQLRVGKTLLTLPKFDHAGDVPTLMLSGDIAVNEVSPEVDLDVWCQRGGPGSRPEVRVNGCTVTGFVRIVPLAREGDSAATDGR